MTGMAAPFPLSQGKGAAYIHTTIIAEICQDMGASISCERCGHVFVPSKPLSDQSEPVDNIELAKALWNHDCHTENRQWRPEGKRGRIT